MTYRRTATLAVLIAAMVTSGVASAAVGHGSALVRQMATSQQSAPCRTPNSKLCADYQRKLLQIVQQKELNGRYRSTIAAVGRHQLDALIASIG